MQSAHGICVVTQAKDAKVFMVVRALDTHAHQWSVINPNGTLPPQRGGHSVSPSCQWLCSCSPAAVWGLCHYLTLCMHPLCIDPLCMHLLSLYIVSLLICFASLLLLTGFSTGWLACWLLACLLSHLVAPATDTKPDTKRTITRQT